MLGSNLSADSVASTDRYGDAPASPLAPNRSKISIGRGTKRQILGVRGQSPCELRKPQALFQPGRPLIMREFRFGKNLSHARPVLRGRAVTESYALLCTVLFHANDFDYTNGSAKIQE